MEDLNFDGTKIGLIVRGKLGPQHAPELMAQHADVILADGSPMGFFGEGDPFSGASFGLGSSAASGINMRGTVFDYEQMKIHRPYYVDLNLAMSKYRVVSTVLVISVNKAEAALFATYWKALKEAPGVFNILGYNCSTRASEGFAQAGVTRSGVPGLDTPNNLYKQISAVRGDKVASYTGYLGFVKKPDGSGFEVRIEPSK